MSMLLQAPQTLDMAAHAWRRRRSELTHDWLCNRLLPRLHACATLLRARCGTDRHAIDSLLDILSEWPMRSVEALQLANEYEAVMSPLRAAESIAARLPADVGRCLQSTALACWSRRHDIDALLDELHTAREGAERSHRLLSVRIEAGPLMAMAADCERLVRAFSRLPSRILM